MEPLLPSKRFQLNRRQRALVLNPPPLRTASEYNRSHYNRLKAEGRCVVRGRPVCHDGMATCKACRKRPREARLR
jgi:hypothetical protein